MRANSLSDLAIHHEAKEEPADPRPQALKNQKRIRWNTLGIFGGRAQRRCLAIVRRRSIVLSNRPLRVLTIKLIDNLTGNIEPLIAI